MAMQWANAWPIIKEKVRVLREFNYGRTEELNPNDVQELLETLRQMVTHHSDMVYHNYPEIFREFILSNVLPSLSKEGERILHDFVAEWVHHKWMVDILSTSLQEIVVPEGAAPLDIVGQRCFTGVVYERFKGEIIDATWVLIERQLHGNKTKKDNLFIKKFFASILEMGVNENLEAELVHAARGFYDLEASMLIIKDPLVDYIPKAKEYLKLEDVNISSLDYLSPSSKRKLLKEIRGQLLYTYIKGVLKIGKLQLEEYQLEHFSWLFCSEEYQGLESVVDRFKEHIMAKGVSLVEEANDSSKKMFMRKIMSLHTEFTTYVNDCLLEHHLFHQAIHNTFLDIYNMNVGGISTAKLLALFFNDILTKQTRENRSVAEIEATLEHALTMLRLIEDKSLFGESYVVQLANRLLSDASFDVEVEKSMAIKFNRILDYDLVRRMEKMLKDKKVSGEINAKFKEYVSNNPDANSGIDLSMNLVSMGRWPSYKSLALNLPNEMEKCLDEYSMFYLMGNRNRTLRPIHSQGTCVIETHFGRRTFDLQVTTAQAAVLLQFNGSDRLSCHQIADQLGIPHRVVVKLLRSLSSASCRILLKETGTEEISETDVFVCNSKFNSRMRLVMAPPPDENEGIFVDKASTIRCAIIRIMKDKRVLGFEQLVTQCVEQLKDLFTPKTGDINKEIGQLMVDGWLETGKFDSKLLKYVPR